MAWRFVKQPNGLYARFSEETNGFTHVDLTRQQAMQMSAAEFGAHAGGIKVERADTETGRWAEVQALMEKSQKNLAPAAAAAPKKGKN